MNRRGYIYATADSNTVESMISSAQAITGLGAGELRVHRNAADDPGYIPVSEHGLFDAPTGADLFLDPSLIRKYFPYVTDRAVALLHTRRCGWFAAQQFGMYMFEEAVAHGVQYINGRVEGVGVVKNRIKSVKVSLHGAVQEILTPIFVIAAGPLQKEVGRMIGVEIPVMCEPHLKVMLNDPHQAIPRDMSLFIWNDPVTLPWSEDEKAALAESDETCWLLDELPVGVHGRPEGDGNMIILQWGYRDAQFELPVFPIPVDHKLPEIALRGMATVIPGLAKYLNQLPKPFIDGGYYARTPENRPLIGPLSVDGAFIIGGFGGFGMQVSCGASDLLADHILRHELPSYAPAFLLSRYNDPHYQEMLGQWETSGQI